MRRWRIIWGPISDFFEREREILVCVGSIGFSSLFVWRLFEGSLWSKLRGSCKATRCWYGYI